MSGFQFIGGALCLDFVNTVDWTGDRPAGSERLASYAALVDWAVAAGAVDRRTGQALRAHAAAHPAPAGEALARALDLRALARQVGSSVARGRRLEGRRLDRLNRLLGQAMAHRVVARSARGYARQWAEGPLDLDRPLWPVVESLAEFLLAEGPSRVRQCPGPECGWLFVDRSRPGSRRWCDMATCGNRAKARRHYRRLRTGA